MTEGQTASGRVFKEPVANPEGWATGLRRVQDSPLPAGPHPDVEQPADASGASGLTILSVIRDPLPPTRSDVLTLFGKELPQVGIGSVLVGQFQSRKDACPWQAGKAYVLGRRGGIPAAVLAPLWDLVGIVQAFSEYSIRCVQVRDKIPSALVCGAIARLANLPFVYWMSFPFVEGHEARAKTVGLSKGPIIWIAHSLRARLSRWAFYRLILPGADHVFVQSEHMREWLTTKGIPRQKMTAVPMGVDTEVFRRAGLVPVDAPRLDGRRVILYTGALSKDRQSTFLLDLLLALKPFEPSIFLLLAGDADAADEQAWIREEIERRSLQDDVLLTGWLSREESLRYAIRAEVGLSPIPRSELFDGSSPTKLIEYLALGIPAVANDIPDQRLVIEQSRAGLCVPMKIEAFRDAVLKLLRGEALREGFSRRGPSFVRAQRAYPILARRVAQTYRDIVAAHRARKRQAPRKTSPRSEASAAKQLYPE